MSEIATSAFGSHLFYFIIIFALRCACSWQGKARTLTCDTGILEPGTAATPGDEGTATIGVLPCFVEALFLNMVASRAIKRPLETTAAAENWSYGARRILLTIGVRIQCCRTVCMGSDFKKIVASRRWREFSTMIYVLASNGAEGQDLPNCWSAILLASRTLSQPHDRTTRLYFHNLLLQEIRSDLLFCRLSRRRRRARRRQVTIGLAPCFTQRRQRVPVQWQCTMVYMIVLHSFCG